MKWRTRNITREGGPLAWILGGLVDKRYGNLEAFALSCLIAVFLIVPSKRKFWLSFPLLSGCIGVLVALISLGLSIVRRAFFESLSAINQTVEGIVFAAAVGVIVIVWEILKLRKEKRKLELKIFTELIGRGAIATVGAWFAVFLFFSFYQVPREITKAANKLPGPALRVPPATEVHKARSVLPVGQHSPHIRVPAIYPTPVVPGNTLFAQIEIENDGDDDAEVITNGSLIIGEVFSDVAEQRKYENSLFAAGSKKQMSFSQPEVQVIPSHKPFYIPMKQQWSSQWDYSDNSKEYGAYLFGRVKYRSIKNHRIIGISEYCKHFSFDAKKIIACKEHNLEPRP
jgi:hypothetical protein